MGKNSGVSWADHSWGCWRGCHKRPVPECQNCYAEREQTRYGRDHSVVVRAAKATFEGPLKWPAGRVFTPPWSDFWIEEADPWREDAYAVMRQRPDHTWIIPSKRPENVAARLPDDWGPGWPNVWGLVSAGTQATADLYVPQLLRLPFAVRGVSVEPFLGPVNFVPWLTCQFYAGEEKTRTANINGWIQTETYRSARLLPRLDWLVVGCESAAGGRVGRLGEFQSERDWIDGAVAVVEQARSAGVACFVKQVPANGRVCHEIAEFPEPLRVQEFPT